MTTSTRIDPATVVQRQLDAYNARDLAALRAIYADQVQVFEHPATPIATSAEQLCGNLAVRFQEPNLHAELLSRIVCDQLVIDHERVTRTFPEGTGYLEMVAMYEVEQDRIVRAWFKFGPRQLDSK